jgi:hypothetical protein
VTGGSSLKKDNGAANPQRRFIFPAVIVISFSWRAWRLGG